ncbi:MAG: response regulator RpfG family c-di-GMP phosphodiesterase [Enterobacterales bacterium]|jgi:response regulator RpfG family c-di-GMP phosphodiesterase
MTETTQQQKNLQSAKELTKQTPATLLLVDDESNILSSLRRVFRPEGYTILTATSGAEALKILQKSNVDLIISDMRMPEMDGSVFLSKVAKQWPDIIRILLTGYADMTSTISAINEGKIFQYISKPWEDNDIIITVRHSLKHRQLKQERDQLLELTQKQNDELQDLNSNLEDKVKERTEELSQTMYMLETAHETLKKDHTASIKVFSNIIEMRESTEKGHSRRVAEKAMVMTKHLNISPKDTRQVLYAALLHDIGKIGLANHIINKSYYELTAAERIEYCKHPVLGEGTLMALGHLHQAARLIRSHLEYYNGQGYPDRLKGTSIPLGARIIAIANDYDLLEMGILGRKKLTAIEAREYLLEHKGSRYDPDLVDLFIKHIPITESIRTQQKEIGLKAEDLEAGMVLSKDLIINNIMLLSIGYLLDDSVILRIQHFINSTKVDPLIYVSLKGR